MPIRAFAPILLLLVSNTFMTFAWYGHLRFKDRALWLVILASWGIALFEYLFAVPANRMGSAHFSLTQLKIIQECVSLSVFLVIAATFFKQPLKLNTLAAMIFVVLAVVCAFWGSANH
jgi:uncharacterized protein (DUF486 family)